MAIRILGIEPASKWMARISCGLCFSHLELEVKQPPEQLAWRAEMGHITANADLALPDGWRSVKAFQSGVPSGQADVVIFACVNCCAAGRADGMTDCPPRLHHQSDFDLATGERAPVAP